MARHFGLLHCLLEVPRPPGLTRNLAKPNSSPYGRPLGVLRAGALVEPAGSASAGGCAITKKPAAVSGELCSQDSFGIWLSQIPHPAGALWACCALARLSNRQVLRLLAGAP